MTKSTNFQIEDETFFFFFLNIENMRSWMFKGKLLHFNAA